MTSNERQHAKEDDLKILKVEYLSNQWLDLPQILDLNSGDQTQMKNTWNYLQWKVTSNGRHPSIIKSWISQQPLIGSSSNFRPKLRGANRIKKYLKWRRPPIEDDLKILKVEYLSNHWSDLPQILNLSSGDQTKIKNAWNEDDLQWKTTSKY